MFKKLKYKNLIEDCIRKAAKENKIEWIELNVQPEHIHGTSTIPITMSPSKAVQLLKGRSAYLFFRNHPKARLRYPKGHLWARGKHIASLGFIQLEKANEYVRNQDMHHNTKWIV